ncbi:MAG: hypothetical protein U5J63_08070 [Fodinibius sp.]|nr:hypothetical protein [Fodinibius sp.]
MRQADFAIAPSSTILYEILAARLPVITGYYVDNQSNIYQGFSATDAVIGVGELSEQSLQKGLAALTLTACQKIQEQQKKVIDGRNTRSESEASLSN